MITPLDVYNQIQKTTKVFQMVAYTAEFQRIMDETVTLENQLPACFICFKGSTVDNADVLNGAYGVESLDIVIFVVLSDADDQTGSSGMDQNITVCTEDLKKCLYGWVPNEITTQPVTYDGYDLVSMSGSRIIYECRFTIEQQITQLDDGYIPVYNNLQEVDTDVKYKECDIKTVSFKFH